MVVGIAVWFYNGSATEMTVQFKPVSEVASYCQADQLRKLRRVYDMSRTGVPDETGRKEAYVTGYSLNHIVDC